MTKQVDKQVAIAVPGEWAIQKLLGPTLDQIGNDMQKLYSVGRDKILTVAIRKSDVKDGKKANLRVARDVFWNGSFTDESICAEYFGGILASSRSKDGKDDRGIYYTDIIKSLSSQQLLLHYIIYRALNKLWLEMPKDKKRPNAGMGSELDNYKIWFASKEIEKSGIISVEKDVIALHNKGLVGGGYEANTHPFGGNKTLPYVKISPTTLGIQLYAVAFNKLELWRTLPFEDFGEFSNIETPRLFAFSVEELLNKAGLK